MTEETNVSHTDWKGIYATGALITGTISFFVIYAYAVSHWGLLFGIILGWIPAGIGAFISGIIWPVMAILFLWVVTPFVLLGHFWY